jgi:hypothetical protein
VTRGGREIALPPIPLRMLEALMRASPGCWDAKNWNAPSGATHRPIPTRCAHICTCCAPRSTSPSRSPLLHTLRGIGWQIAAPEQASLSGHEPPA